MAIEDWETGADGNLTLAPVVAWNSALAGMYALLRIQFVRSEDQMKSGSFEAVQVGMTSKQARLLAQDLLKTADRLDAQPLGTKQ